MEDEHRTALRRSGPARKILVAIAIAAAVVFVAVRVWEDRSAQERSRPPAAPPQPPAAAAPEPPPAQGADVADPSTVASLVERVSSHDLVRRFFAGSEWIRRVAIVTDNLAEGVSPRRQLRFAAPAAPFSVERRGGATVIAADSYRRYDAVGDAAASLDAGTVAALYRAVHGPLEEAYRALGYPTARLDGVVSRALHRIEAAPVVDGDVALRSEDGLFVFEDARLEGMREVEKHLLRMGPRNTRLVQAKARELRGALGLPAPERAGRTR